MLECLWYAHSQGVMDKYLLDDVFVLYVLIPEKIVWQFEDHMRTFGLCGHEGKWEKWGWRGIMESGRMSSMAFTREMVEVA